MSKWVRTNPIQTHEVVIAVCGMVVGFGVIVAAAFGFLSP